MNYLKPAGRHDNFDIHKTLNCLNCFQVLETNPKQGYNYIANLQMIQCDVVLMNFPAWSGSFNLTTASVQWQPMVIIKANGKLNFLFAGCPLCFESLCLAGLPIT